MTAEKALKTLLSSSLITYEKLKTPEGSEPVHPLIIVSMATMDMGWNFCIDKSEEEIQGLVIGTEEYMDKIFPKDK